MSVINIKSKKKLEEVMLRKYAVSALRKTQQDIYTAIQESIYEYYKEYPSPQIYERTYKFLNSLIKTEIIKEGNSITCEVKIDEKYLQYVYKSKSGLPATGLDVVRWANRDVPGYGNHGGTVDTGRDDGFWDIGLRDLGGKTGIIALLKNNLIKRGLNVK